MQCRKARTMLAKYLAGECRSSNSKAIEKHLSACPECASELEELRFLNRTLNLWQAEPAPAELWDAVMSEVEEISNTRSATGKGSANSRNTAARRRNALLLRDLTVAVVASMVIFCSSGAWLAGERMLTAGESINGAVSVYTRVTGAVMERATGTAGEYTRKFLFEEWEQDEMYKPSGS